MMAMGTSARFPAENFAAFLMRGIEDEAALNPQQGPQILVYVWY